MVEEENQVPQVVLCPPGALAYSVSLVESKRDTNTQRQTRGKEVSVCVDVSHSSDAP